MKKEKTPSAFSRLMEYAESYKILTYLSWMLSFLSALTALLPLVYIFFIIREVLEVAPDFTRATSIVHNGIMAVVFSAAALLINFGALMCSHVSAFRIGSNIKRSLLRHMTKLPLGFSDEMGSGKLRKIINDSSNAAETYLAHNLPDMAGAIATPLGMVVMMFVVDWRFGLVSILPVFLAFLCMGKMLGPAMKEDMRLYNNALEDMNNEAVEYVRGIPVVKTFGQTIHSFSRFKSSIQNYYKFCIAYTKRCRQPMLFFLVFINSAFAFLIALALILSDGGANVTSGILLNFLFYVIITPVIATTMQKVMFMSEGSMTVADALDRINSVLDRKPFENSEKSETPDDHSVAFENVSFSYDGENLALSNVSFDVKSGASLAFVGPSGGGKTTVSRLAARFWDATKGRITFGGEDIATIDPEALLKYYSIVFQDVTLFNNTVMENIRIGKKDATDEEAIQAARLANCDEFISRLPDGYNTVIGENGAKLSGGERQRISIARAFLKDAPVILLDEATASLDAENETLIQQSLSRLIKNKTAMIIAHRMRTIAGADKIVVIKDGKADEQGKPEELKQKNGFYNRMLSLQTKG